MANVFENGWYRQYASPTTFDDFEKLARTHGCAENTNNADTSNVPTCTEQAAKEAERLDD